jgi:hypothetical protein
LIPRGLDSAAVLMGDSICHSMFVHPQGSNNGKVKRAVHFDLLLERSLQDIA